MSISKETIKNRSAAYRMLMIDLAIVIICGFLFFVFAGLEFAYSVILGGLAFIMPNFLFVKLSLGMSAANSGKIMLIWFYIGEAIKIVTTVLIFVVSIMLIKPIISLMVVSYGVILLINLIGLVFLMGK